MMSWVELATLALLPLFLVADTLTGRSDASAPGWRGRALVVTAANFALSLFLGQAYATWFDATHLFDGAALGTAGGAVVGVLVYGTWRNPPAGAQPVPQGFCHGASSRVLEMLAFRDVSKPGPGEGA